jgi:hypothetical protein
VQFALIETATSYLIDYFVWCRRNKLRIRIGFAIVLYCIGLIMTCPVEYNSFVKISFQNILTVINGSYWDGMGFGLKFEFEFEFLV